MTRDRRRAEALARNLCAMLDRNDEDVSSITTQVAIADLILAERQRATRSAIDGLARKCRRNIEADMNVEFYQDVLRLIDDARIERAREARARGRKR